MVGMAGGRGGAASLLGKVEGREERFFTIDRVSSSSTTRYIRYTHVCTHTYFASCSCDLEPEPTNSHRSVSLFFDLSIREERSSAVKIDATFVICGTEAVFVFEKGELSFYIYTFIIIEGKTFRSLDTFRTSLKGIYVAKRLG